MRRNWKESSGRYEGLVDLVLWHVFACIIFAGTGDSDHRPLSWCCAYSLIAFIGLHIR
jgi:hypothetical protein